MEFLVNLTTKFENFFSSLGAGSGVLAPLLRSGIGFVIGTTIVFAVRPSLSFNSDGTVRDWALSNRHSPNSTYFPWWFWGFLLAFFFGTFI
jgi:hypothetical protein